MITQSEIKRLVDYYPDTGVMTAKVKIGRTEVGQELGGDNGGGYLRFRLNGKRCMVHRLAWLYVYGEMPDGGIDHINGDASDNRIENLRSVSQQENMKNRKKPRANTSGRVGVSWINRFGKWQAFIWIDGVMKSLGYFERYEDAVSAREKAEKDFNYHENHGR